jgi:hypothetical protein
MLGPERSKGPLPRPSRGRSKTARGSASPGWAAMPGVEAYRIIAADGEVLDAWGEPDETDLLRAAAFRSRFREGSVESSCGLERASGELGLVSVARRDGWFVHAWVSTNTDVARLIATLES